MYSVNEISTWRAGEEGREGTGVGPLREQIRSGGKVGGDEGDIDEEAETEERGIGQ